MVCLVFITSIHISRQGRDAASYKKKKKNVNDKKQLDSLMKELRCSAVH